MGVAAVVGGVGVVVRGVWEVEAGVEAEVERCYSADGALGGMALGEAEVGGEAEAVPPLGCGNSNAVIYYILRCNIYYNTNVSLY